MARRAAGGTGVGGVSAGPALERGVAVVSIDTELAWGESHHRDGSGPRRDYGSERIVIDQILEVFDRYEISATWAIVGHLFLDQCAPVDGRAHPEIVRPVYPTMSGDWFDIDPCSTLAAAPSYYGRDIVAAINRCRVPQEIGCHSFSHLIADGCGEEAFGSDLAACRAVAANDGLDVRSFVYPRNAIDHIDALGGHGFVCYRGSAEPSAAPAGRLVRYADRLRPLARSAVVPIRHPSGVWNVPQTYLFAPATRARHLPVGLWAHRPVARMRLAARERSLFHLWFHPYNVTAAPDRALRGLEAICRAATRLRDAGRLDIMTMGALADRLEAESTDPT
jgi:peptidoglycan/xylan/chitin deacetylase (PgdA/CDA1 family)